MFLGGCSIDIIAFGNRVRAARERLGITQEDLAASVGMSPSLMSIVERGVKVPRTFPFCSFSISVFDLGTVSNNLP